MSALEADHSLGLIRQQINQLTFSFVTPLSADNNDIFSHNYPKVSQA
jgi:hypothetical protein